MPEKIPYGNIYLWLLLRTQLAEMRAPYGTLISLGTVS